MQPNDPTAEAPGFDPEIDRAEVEGEVDIEPQLPVDEIPDDQPTGDIADPADAPAGVDDREDT
jgi:hypothetical protein